MTKILRYTPRPIAAQPQETPPNPTPQEVPAQPHNPSPSTPDELPQPDPTPSPGNAPDPQARNDFGRVIVFYRRTHWVIKRNRIE